MKKYKIILSSNSPRRKELLAGLDVDFEVKVIPNINESYPDNLSAHEIPKYIAVEKAAAYNISDSELVITADTVVVLNNIVLGKPKDAQEAIEMLRMLSGNTHEVITGVCLTTATKQNSFSVSTEVTFKKISEDEINYYVSKYHPFDKAGAYGIQEWIGYIGIDRIEGSFFTIMGLPVHLVYQELAKFRQ